MFVIKHKFKDTFIYKGPNEVLIADIESCSTFRSLTEARQALSAFKTRSYLAQQHEKPEDFEAIPVKIQIA